MLTIDTEKTLWNKYHQSLLGFIHKRVKSINDAEDILQDVFVKIHLKLDTLDDKFFIDCHLVSIVLFFQITSDILL